MEQKLAWSAQSDGSNAQIHRLEGEVEEQRQLRLQDARQVSKYQKILKNIQDDATTKLALQIIKKSG